MEKKHYRFETAAYSYFLMTNYSEQKERFLAGEISNPRFKYPERFSQEVVIDRLLKVAGDRVASRSLQFVGLACAFQKNDRLLTQFRRANASLFGEPEPKYYNKILARYARNGTIARLAERSDNVVFRGMIEHGLELKTEAIVDDEVYRRYRRYFKRYFGEIKPMDNIQDAMKQIFRLSGLKERGWELVSGDDVIRARTISRRKVIVFNRNQRARQNVTDYNSVALHEIFGHALRDTGSDGKYSLAESEGWAVLLEQLYEERFRFRRTYRYLAATLAWGCLGEMLDFRCTYEAMWRLMSLSERYGEADAKNHAFDEVSRIFRGGRPDLPGAVFLKDTAYLRGNMDIWRYLSKSPLVYEDFVDILEGRKNILK